MSGQNRFTTYLKNLQKNLSTGVATEHTHRSALKDLLERQGDGVLAINEPKRIECGAPDYVITRTNVPIGYVEAKDVGTNLDSAKRSDQMHRYLSLNNLILTNYLEFRWYVEGENQLIARLGTVGKDGKVKPSKGGVEAVTMLLHGFFAQRPPVIGDPIKLAQSMAGQAHMMRALIEKTFERENKNGALHAQLKAFQDTLIADLTPSQFADMYAQTITYGLFAARVRVPIGQNFTRENAAWNLPKTNPFLRKLFNELAGPDLDDRIAWLVDELAHLLAQTDMASILADFGKRTRQEDPVVHFYETFLATYDPKMRQSRGVYYTPEPVVSYIVRSIDGLLKTHFDRPMGLADENTLILDPAVGTATFLYFVIQQIHQTLSKDQAGTWNSYVEKHLLTRIFGFELLMAPYAVAHMKLGILLQDTGYDFTGDQRLGIYLTNSLEEAVIREETLGFAKFISDEANAAAEVKKNKPIMVVLGNPPYSVSSLNPTERLRNVLPGQTYKRAGKMVTATKKLKVKEETFIGELLADYKQNLKEKKLNLDDDYIKFIRFAQWRINKTGQGIIGFISNNSYLAGITHRRMRQSLLETFDKIYVLNLHGNARIGENAHDGGVDENVFDIMQGVAIALLIKDETKKGKYATVFYDDFFGKREQKYKALLSCDAQNTEWKKLQPSDPYFFFVPKDFEGLTEYEKGWKVTDIFLVHGSGLQTDRDDFCFDFEREALCHRVQRFFKKDYDDTFRERYRLYPSSSYDIEAKRDNCIFSEENVQRCLYRPFDRRWLYYKVGFTSSPANKLMRHMGTGNLALLTMRQVALRTQNYSHFGLTDLLVERRCFLSAHGAAYVFPLYLYTTPEDTEGTFFATDQLIRKPNLSPKFIAAIERKLDLKFVPDGKGNLETKFGPEDILHYAYAIFHSPTYRDRYAEFLKIDFPRLPLTSDRSLFKALAAKGEELIGLHLMTSPKLDQFITKFPVSGSNEVEKPRYAEERKGEKTKGKGEMGKLSTITHHATHHTKHAVGRVYINKTQYFEGIDREVWEFRIGGYQVLHKWLKDRKRKKLSFDELFYYQKIIVALKETMRLMEEVDELSREGKSR